MYTRKALTVLLTAVLSGVLCQNLAPNFNLDMNGFGLSEETEVGTLVYVLNAVDPEQRQLYYGVSADMFEVRNSAEGGVYLARQLDYEREPQLTFTTWVSEADNVNRVERRVTVTVLDANDMLPYFTEQTYKTTIPEGTAIGTIVVANIEVLDVDQVGAPITVRCVNFATEQARDACSVFEVDVISRTSRSWRGNILLKQQLDYERRASYQVPLEAWDGNNRVLKTVEVSVQDGQDLPPQFVSSLSAVIPENIQPGTPVLQVSAVDPDPGSTRTIQYSLVNNPNNLFTIDPASGQISIFGDVNRESNVFANGFITLTVQATEVMPDGFVSTSPADASQTQVTITIRDNNDNGPKFNPTFYSANISETIGNNVPLPGLAMSVSDPDQGNNAVFELRLLNHQDIFEVFPSTATRSTTASIRVRSNAQLDYDRGLRTYNLQVRAQETLTANRLYGDASVNINLLDENDNAPQFAQTDYRVTISELTPPGTSVITITATDIDSGIYGQEGLRYKLVGNHANKFEVDTRTGLVTVRDCPTPGSGNCIDFEQNQEFNLEFWVGDNFAEGNTRSVPLIISIRDENDNPPTIPDYVGYIGDGETVPNPPIQVEAVDPDGNSQIRYSIVGGNQAGLWQVGGISGVISATRPVRYSQTPGRSGRYDLTVQATDGRYTITGQVTIFVQAGNDNTPIFTQNGYYERTIPEDTPSGTVVETVIANDADPPSSPDGQVLYRISTGARGMFDLDENTGVIRVSSGARFDYNIRARYEMIVIGADQGSPQRSATATVVVNILPPDAGKPYFSPARREVSVYENVAINFQVTQMTAIDPDNRAVFVYEFEEPWQAWDAFGQAVRVTDFDFRSLFRIDRNSGNVRVAQTLNHDRVARMSVTVRATDTSGGPDDFAIGTLIINILDVNTDPPRFVEPWTPQNPNYVWRIIEEQPLGSYVNTLVAIDPVDSIEYRIVLDQQGFFAINSVTGVVTVAKRMDYEQIQSTRFVAIAVDSGNPSQTATASVRVDIININDNIPIFSEVYYEVNLPENSSPGNRVTTITATDIDLGDYGVVRYSITDPRFLINERTGVITIAPGAVLDREENSVISITATAYDSPLDATVRRTNSVPIYINLIDENDNRPRFTQSTYNATIVDTTPPATSVVQVTATDDDEGPNGDIRYEITGGTGTNLFTIDSNDGLITTRVRINGYSGTYNLTVRGTDLGNPSLFHTSNVYITVIEANNDRPIWEYPLFNNNTVEVLEDQYLGMEITSVKANDPDGNLVNYYFYYNNQYTVETPDFIINPITGVISANQIFDRETRDIYILHLVARDNGIPILDSDRYLTIRILDVDDHNPEFPLYANCCVIPAKFNISEDAPNNTFVGQVNATDKDIGQFANTMYSIVRGNAGNTFYINETTGRIYTKRPIDREVLHVYVLRVRATNFGSNAGTAIRSRPGCKAGCDLDHSEIEVYIYVTDINDNPPKFEHSFYNACIPLDAQIGYNVMSVSAQDVDLGSGMITYRIQQQYSQHTDPNVKSEPAGKTFGVGPQNGTIYSQDLMTFYQNHYFGIQVAASDGTNEESTTVRVWVTEQTKEVMLTLRAAVAVVRENLDCLSDYLSLITGGGIVCIKGLRDHIPDGEDNDAVVEWTDLTFYIINSETKTLMDPAEVIRLIDESEKEFCLLGIRDLVATGAVWEGFVIDPILAAIILIILLLLLALLLLCCCCFCMDKWYKRNVISRYFWGDPWATPNETKAKLYEDQELRMTVGGEGEKAGLDNAAFMGDGTARLTLNQADGAQTRTETTQEYNMNYESSRYMQNAIGAVEGTPSIVAPLEGRDYADAGTAHSTIPHGASASRSYSAMSGMSGHHGSASLREPSLPSPSGIGATLSSSYRDVSLDGFTVLRGVHSVDAQSDFAVHDPLRTWPRNQANSLSGSAPPSYHSYDLGRDAVIHDIPIDSTSMGGEDIPDGMYQGEILLGTHRPPRSRSVPSSEYNQPMTLAEQQMSRSQPHLLDAQYSNSYHGHNSGFSHSQPNLASQTMVSQPILAPIHGQQQPRQIAMSDMQYREERGGGPVPGGFQESRFMESRQYKETHSHGNYEDVF